INTAIIADTSLRISKLEDINYESLTKINKLELDILNKTRVLEKKSGQMMGDDYPEEYYFINGEYCFTAIDGRQTEYYSRYMMMIGKRKSADEKP
ncbi:MAG: hypothetical protein ACOYWZ_14175, partial [Bacillota bacterium]